MELAMKWRCESCGQESDLADLHKDHVNGGDRGEPHYSCPCCHGDNLTELYQCSMCGEWFPGDELYGYANNFVCDGCIEEHITPEEVVDFGNEYGVDVQLNGLVTMVFSDDEINQILMDYLKNEYKAALPQCMRDLVYEDKDEFAEYLTRK